MGSGYLVLEMSDINTKDSLPLMEMLEKELAMLGDNMASVADAFERIYVIFPDPIMKDEMSEPTSPDVKRPDRLSHAIRTIERLNTKSYRLAQKINITLDTVIGSSKTIQPVRGYPEEPK